MLAPHTGENMGLHKVHEREVPASRVIHRRNGARLPEPNTPAVQRRKWETEIVCSLVKRIGRSEARVLSCVSSGYKYDRNCSRADGRPDVRGHSNTVSPIGCAVTIEWCLSALVRIIWSIARTRGYCRVSPTRQRHKPVRTCYRVPSITLRRIPLIRVE